MAFYVGQKVVCIREEDADAPPPYAILGCVYTVSNVFEPYPGETNIELYELPFAGSDRWHAGFCAEDFRPVVEPKTDISIFKAMLNPKTAEIDA